MEMISCPVGRNDDLRGEKTLQIRKGRLTRVDGFASGKFPKTSLWEVKRRGMNAFSFTPTRTQSTDKAEGILKNIQIRCSEQLVDIL